jgi:hypothetical protein
VHLFAIVRGAIPRVHRVSIARNLQTELETLFRSQAEAFLDGSELPFDARHTPESDEIHYIEPFTDADNLLMLGSKSLSCPVFDVSDEMLHQLVGLCVVTRVKGKVTACLQTFDRRHAITRDKFAMIHVGDGFTRLEQRGFVLDTHVVALLRSDRLLFRSFAAANRLFDLAEYFHEATDAELESFAGHRALAVDDVAGFRTIADIKRIRKQVALVLESDILSKVPVRTIVSRAKTEASHLTIQTTGRGKNMKIVLPESRAEVRDLLDFLQENCYRGCLTRQGYVANSKRSVGS